MKINMFDDVNLNGYTLIEGFPGAGLVGPMTSSYMIEKLEMNYIGYIESDSFPPIAIVHDKTPMFPVRIYKDDKHKLVVLISEFIIPPALVYPLTDALLEFIKTHGITHIISVDGTPSEKQSDKVFAIGSNADTAKRISASDLRPITNGVLAGVSSILLVRGMELGLDVIDILVVVNPAIMDPKYAENAIMALKKLIGIDINTDELEQESKEIQAKVKEAMKNTKNSHDTYSNAADAVGPSMYA